MLIFQTIKNYVSIILSNICRSRSHTYVCSPLNFNVIKIKWRTKTLILRVSVFHFVLFYMVICKKLIFAYCDMANISQNSKSLRTRVNEQFKTTTFLKQQKKNIVNNNKYEIV